MPAPELTFVLGPKSKPSWAEESESSSDVAEIIEDSCACSVEDLPSEAGQMKAECSSSRNEGECKCSFSCKNSPEAKTTVATCKLTHSRVGVSRYLNLESETELVLDQIYDFDKNSSMEKFARAERLQKADYIWQYPKLGFMVRFLSMIGVKGDF